MGTHQQNQLGNDIGSAVGLTSSKKQRIENVFVTGNAFHKHTTCTMKDLA